ncbi:MAG: ADP-ribosylglycohydrolase family protein [Glaciihabitans sp.]|nr:ADP-ribosylglycohydrolase family protein [Glaciihabitans sp.]
MKLTPVQNDRAAGVLVGMACGDALGAGYEFGPPLADGTAVMMNGGGTFNWAPGEWTDDTSMAVPVLRAVAAGKDLRDETVLDGIVAAWIDRARTAPDVGIQLSAILRGSAPTAAAVRLVAEAHHHRNGRSGGNGSLMRTAPVALAYLDDPVTLAAVARSISDLTHYETDAGDACVLWCLAIRTAVITGDLDIRSGLDALPRDRRPVWEERIVRAEHAKPRDFERNGWVVEALQAAWSSIVGGSGLVDTLERAVRGGRDTDTVAAIAGALAGAAYGASSAPDRWTQVVHGWPRIGIRDLTILASEAAGAVADRSR